MPLESKIETACRIEVRRKGGLFIKLSPSFFKGIPDRLILLPGGVIFFAEIKNETYQPSPIQCKVHKIIRKLGQLVFIIRNNEELYEAIQTAQLPRGDH